MGQTHRADRETSDMSEFTASHPRWGFLGSGKMATALIQGMIRTGTTRPEAVSASDPLDAARAALAAGAGVHVSGSNLEVVERSTVVVLAVKPQSMPALMDEIRHGLSAHHLVISIAAGVSLSTLRAGLGADRRLVRVMPNTPALVGEGASAYCMGTHATPADEDIVRSCLVAVGQAHRVNESLLDAVTGLSGSGPAYAYLIIEALSDGGVRAGLPRDVATALAAQTLLGAARMVLETREHPGFLKDQVTSPGGTTIAGIHALEKGGLRAALMDAVVAATKRSAELAEAAAEAARLAATSAKEREGPARS
ncbi:MAG: pyrroline-5-carboxylate reductase [Isosphaeraceae bacterium]